MVILWECRLDSRCHGSCPCTMVLFVKMLLVLWFLLLCLREMVRTVAKMSMSAKTMAVEVTKLGVKWKRNELSRKGAIGELR